MDQTEFSFEINRLSGHPDEHEKTHVPCVCIHDSTAAHDSLALHVQVGAIPHPMEKGHHIQWVEFFTGDAFIGRVDFAPLICLPEAVLSVRFDRPGKYVLRCVASCNMHGLWEGTNEIVIE
ncbi:MAG TPA: desulfoferrodoxin family protein [Candidatus Brocadiia bacterium]|nr:desulfoferrodoxin family protein [Candidatus Brocadiia bacterium]